MRMFSFTVADVARSTHACDSDPLCLRVLTGLVDDEGNKLIDHVCDDILGRLGAEAKGEMDAYIG